MPRPRFRLATLFLALTLTLPTPAMAASERERIGLVLSGGGARGLAHVGVLKVLEREHIPVDVIAGTSMGAIIGGLYASGLSAEQLERELLRIDWSRMFATRVERQQLSQRRKEEDFEFSAAIEFGLRNGELLAPQGTLSSRGLEILLRRLTLPVRAISDFDQLPTPFRAVATDMETGEQRVLGEGGLAQAMRSSMSVPGVFAPTLWSAPKALEGAASSTNDAASGSEDHILGDGGLVNNLPVDVARSMGAQRIIAVNVGTPLAGRASLNSLVGVTAQMITILTEQNVLRSIATLSDQDQLITPHLGSLTNTDFARTAELIRLGELEAEELLPQLRRYAVSPELYNAWRLARQQVPLPPPLLADVGFAGSQLTHPERLANRLQSHAGAPFDQAKAERDANLLISSGDYERVDYRVEPHTDATGKPAGEGLSFELEDKPWGPNYFRVGIDLSTDLSGNSAFDLRVSHNRHWLTEDGLEWRNQASIGQHPRLFSELYQPLTLNLGGSSEWFASAWGELARLKLKLYQPDSGQELGELSRQSGNFGLDLGQPWGGIGELRVGLIHESWRIRPVVIGPDLQLQAGQLDQIWNESGLRLRAVVDQLDYANFPQAGYRVLLEYVSGQVSGGPNDRRASFDRAEGQATWVHSWGPHTLNLNGRGLVARQPADSTQGPYSLGGFQQLSGYQPGQLMGRALLFGRASYYLRLGQTPVLSRGVFVGGSLEAGNAWQQAHEASLSDLRYAASLFVGTDTGLGPLYLAVGRAPRGGSAVYLFIGRP
ncbi:MAG: patatin-like phospholipase family protein [Paucibacter sp.]|nr:patatin-like phospholipase family protein [Roseateles sp.]